MEYACMQVIRCIILKVNLEHIRLKCIGANSFKHSLHCMNLGLVLTDTVCSYFPPGCSHQAPYDVI